MDSIPWLLTWLPLAAVLVDYNYFPFLVFPGVYAGSPSFSSSFDPVRNTTYGKVRGTVRTLHFLGGSRVETYMGIPYASPPVGDLRFEFPLPPEPWEGVKDARHMPKACPQAYGDLSYVRKHLPEFKANDMDEDCLYLNIYVPAASPQRKEEEPHEEEEEEEEGKGGRRTRGGGGGGGGRPVLIHVHGGSNEVGMGAMLGGDIISVLADIIVVTFNYRLGFFGFLSIEGHDLPGNYGLRDQTEAFRWVQENIRHFGGDPAKVTIQGHSAGGNDVGQHVLSPLSKGLFRHVIMMSGSPLAYWSIYRSGTRDMEGGPASPSGPKFLEAVHCDGTISGGSVGVKGCLKNTPWRVINGVPSSEINPGIIGQTPTVDGDFIPLSPEQALDQLTLNGHAFMTGITGNEGSLPAKMVKECNRRYHKCKGRFSFNENFTRDYNIRPYNSWMYIPLGVPNLGSMIFHEYKSWHDPDNHTEDLISVSRLMGDPTFVAPAVAVAEAISARHDNVYFYSFDHVSRLSKDLKWMGVPHGRDLFYLFGCPLSGHPLHSYTELDQHVSRLTIDIWANFVRYGRPFQTSEPNETFPPFESRNQSYFVITSDGRDVTIRHDRHHRSRQVSFWNYLVPKLRLSSSAPSAQVTFQTLTWVFVALTSALLVLVLLLSACVCYFKRLARERCVIHATDEKNVSSCRV